MKTTIAELFLKRTKAQKKLPVAKKPIEEVGASVQLKFRPGISGDKLLPTLGRLATKFGGIFMDVDEDELGVYIVYAFHTREQGKKFIASLPPSLGAKGVLFL